MRRTIRLLTCALALFAAAGSAATAQEQPTTSGNDEYALELPTSGWKSVARAEERRNSEFVYNDRMEGYLRVRREMVEGDTKLSDFSRAQTDTKLRFLPGFVVGKEERFAGRLSGLVSTYEYTSGGRPMAGRVYYLQADGRTVYVLHFTGLRDRLQRIQNQTDAIARSFRLKQ
jgi:hypothetical protein